MRDIETQQTVNQRINFLIDQFEGGNKSAFGRRVDMKSGVVGDLVGGRLNKPSYDAIIKILSAYPQVNADWFLFGRGSMLEPSNVELNQQKISADELIYQVITVEEANRNLENMSDAKELKRKYNQIMQGAIARVDYLSDMLDKQNSLRNNILKNGNDTKNIDDEILQTRREITFANESLDSDRARLTVFDRWEVAFQKTITTTVYNVSGEVDVTKPYGGLLAYRLNISKKSAYQLVATGLIKSLNGQCVTEYEVRIFFGRIFDLQDTANGNEISANML